MRLIAYYPWVYLKGGAERLLLETVTRSRHEWTIYTNHYDRSSTFPGFSDVHIVELARVDVKRDITKVAAASLTIALQRIDDRGHDGALVISEGLGNLMAGHFSVPTACLCLTPLKVAYESATRQQFFAAGDRLLYRAALACFRAVDRRRWQRYARVMCISQEVRKRLLEHRLVEDSRVTVLYPGVDLGRFDVADHREPVFLVAGRIMWQKRIEAGLEAWRHFKPHPDDNPFRLVIAGMVDRKSAAYLRELQQAVVWRHDVEFVVSPSDVQLVDLYRSCWAVLFTAPNEDFGLVPLEGMSCGKPVIASRRGGPAETIVDGETGLLVDWSPRSLGSAISALADLDEGRLDDMALKAQARAAQFGWDRFVAAVDDQMELAAARLPAGVPA